MQPKCQILNQEFSCSIRAFCDGQPTVQVLLCTDRRGKVTTWLLILIHPYFPHHPPRPDPPLYCLPWPSSTIWDCILCTSPFSPSVCASQPPLPRDPSHTSPPANSSVRGEEKKKPREQREQFQTRRHKKKKISNPALPIFFLLSPPCLALPADGLHDFIPPLRANARDHTETDDFFPLSMKRIAKSSAIQHHRLSHQQHEHWIHMLQQKLLARELTNLGAQIQRRGESQF